MARSKKAKVTFYNNLTRTDQPDEVELRHKSTQYTSTGGQLRASTSILSTKLDVSELPLKSEDIVSAPSELELSIEHFPDSDAMDPAYQQYLDETEILTEPSHRKRTPAVSVYLNAHAIDFLIPTKDDPMKQWLPERELFLEELITLEGRGHHQRNECATCHQ
ncbi:hypothetical protein H0H92_011677, partial [Tricholoma furcatifolium]